jgi:hypothetical protein
MTRIKVQAGQSMLESYVKKPGVGLCELVWNAFDEDAKNVEIKIDTNELGGLEQIIVDDDGNGMTIERASRSFATVGDSWKRMPGTLSQGKRPVHGRHGRGRYAAFGLGDLVQWTSTAAAVESEGLAGVHIVGGRNDLRHMDVSSVPPETSKPGTRVTIGLVTEETRVAFDRPGDLRTQLLTEFALHLDRFKDFRIAFLGEEIDPGKVVDAKDTLSLSLPEGAGGGKATLTVIEWKLTDVERRLYLCSAHGTIVDELPPGIQAPGAEFTAYLQWSGFAAGDPLTLEGDTETPAGQVIQVARDVLRDYLAKSSRHREAETVRRWQAEGVYPYTGEPKDAVESAARDVFNVVAMAAVRTLEESKSRSVKALSLSLMRETLESEPEALLPILHKVAKLPAARVEELREILEHTSLAHLIQAGKEVGGRVEFLNGLDSILFDRQVKKRLLERRQLHRILAHETWLFGEEWSLTGDDEPLNAVLRKFLARLGHDVEMATEKPVIRDDGSIGIPDLVLGRSLETSADHTAHLVVELKRPSHKLDASDVDQLRSYASAIVNDERFARSNVSWDFWLVGNETRREVDEMREQTHLPYGVVQSSKKYKITVRTWAEVIGDARHRLKFVQKSLQYESTRDTGLVYLRSKYSEYLPAEVLADKALGHA